MNGIIAIIPARFGSKGVPGKNVRLIRGRPMIEYTIQAAVQSSMFEYVYVTTDDDRVAEIAFNQNVQVIRRPSDLAQDTSSSVDVVTHLLESINWKQRNFQYFALLQPTSPLRNSTHIADCLKKFLLSRRNFCVSVTEKIPHPYKMLLTSENECVPVSGDWDTLHATRQSLPMAYYPNGAIFAASIPEFLLQKKFLSGSTYLYPMSQIESLDVDDFHDLELAEFYLSRG